ncbi:MAG: hypothetical protein E7281_04510 [Lachnospiraceae bacterium]|nr:hypothetical protein [Lachnospiraceae bacterium]
MAYKVGKFEFGTLDEANEAQKEYQAIEYITKQLDLNNLSAVKSVYDQLQKQNMFHTAIGLSFMKKMEAQIAKLENAVADNDSHEEVSEEVMDRAEDSTLDTNSSVVENAKTKTAKESRTSGKVKPKKIDRELKKYKTLTSIFRTTTIALLLMVIGMFYVASTINSPNILNYKEQITNEYASWAQELSDKESALNKRENELKEREEKLQQQAQPTQVAPDATQSGAQSTLTDSDATQSGTQSTPTDSDATQSGNQSTQTNPSATQNGSQSTQTNSSATQNVTQNQ